MYTSEAIIHFLGFVGLASVGVILLKVPANFALTRNIFSKSARFIETFVSVLTAISYIAILALTVYVVSKIYPCLIGKYCGPSVASGWAYLAFLGVAFICYEFFVRMLKLFKASSEK